MILTTRGLTKRFGGLVAVNALDLDVGPREIVGVLGPNGAGKTTVFNLLGGVYPCSAGEITFAGHSIQNRRPFEIARLGLGRTFQIVRPFADLTVLQNVLAAIGARFCSGWLSMLAQYRRSAYLDEGRRLLALTEIVGWENERARNLPLGLLRRLEIARALALRPRLLLLDESFSGLSHKELESQIDLVRRLRDDGMSVLLIEHNMREAMRLCDRIDVLDHGAKIAEGSPRQIQDDPRVVTAYLGRDDA